MLRVNIVASTVNMSSLSISPSGVQILAKVAGGAPATLSELASKLRLPPTKIRSDIDELERNGWAQFDPNCVVVRITPKGLNAYDLFIKHPEIAVARVDQPMDHEIDLDAAIDQALERKSR